MRPSPQHRPFSVVLIGPDGSGKTTVARALAARRDLPFAERQLVKWTFQVLPRLEPFVDWWERRIHRIPQPDAAHDGMRNTLPLWQSLAITSYYAVDMCLGRAVLWNARGRSLMFLFDRSFFDYFILMGHRRLPQWYLRLLSRIVPRPDLLLYIKRDAELIYRDKPELTAGEIARQQDILEQLVASHPAGVTIDANAGAEDTIDRAARVIALHAPSPAVTPRPTVLEMFDARATETPDAPAIEIGTHTLTYRALRQRAWELAERLRAKAVAAGTRVAIQGERSPGMVAAMLATWRAGGVILIVDASHPAERRRQLIDLGGADVLLDLSDNSIASIDRAHAGGDRPPVADAAYIFFTSGSTGAPKGVLGRHAGLSHFIEWQGSTFDVGAADRVAHLTNVTFDVMLRDVLLPLTRGATLVIPTHEEDGAGRVCDWLASRRITIAHAVPSLSRVWLSSSTATPSSFLRLTLFAGEPLTADLVTRWRERFPRTRVMNLYGPTETTLAKCAGEVADPPEAGVQPVGHPLPDTHVLILGADGQLCGPEVAGEIYIRTPYRTAGYLAAPPADAARFTPNPHTGREDDVVYRTGDRGLYRRDGQIAVLGRTDRQLKVRGVRVEPGETEMALRTCTDVKDCVVTGYAGATGETELVAYVAATGVTDSASLRRLLEQVLPSYLVPSYFVCLDALPLNANGKLDRRALPDPIEWLRQASGRQAASGSEHAVADAWRDVLGFAPPAVDIDFFTLGGNSLKALLLASTLTDRWKISVPIPLLYDRPTIAAQASWLDGAQRYDEAHVARRHMVFGEGREHRVFAFPPLLGYGLAYHRLAQFVPSHAFVAFDFPEDGDPIAVLADEVMALGDGPYVLVGYSAGGNLAFDVTKVLEARGRRVNAIVMLDAKRFVEAEVLTDDEIEAIIHGNLQHLGAAMEADDRFQQFVRHDYARARLTAKMRAFLRFERGHRNDGRINADIHFVHSPDKQPCRTWQAVTSGQVHLHQGFGRHIEMAHGDNADANGRLLSALLTNLAFRPQSHDSRDGRPVEWPAANGGAR